MYNVHSFLSYIANWDGIEDRESGLLAYTWCISSSETYDCDVLIREDPHDGVTEQTYWTNTGLARFSNLSDGSYYITVDAINRAGYGGSMVTTIHHSTPYILDTTPPQVDEFEVNEYNIDLNILTVTFKIRYVCI